MIARRIAIPLLGALLAGCAVGPDYRRPEIDLPGRFAGVANGEADGRTDGKAAGKTDAASLASQNWPSSNAWAKVTVEPFGRSS